MLTHRRIQANPDKYKAIINMRSPNSLKEVQQLTGCIAALSQFPSRSGELSFHFFSYLEKGNRFNWNEDCEKAFSELKEFLSKPPVLQRP